MMILAFRRFCHQFVQKHVIARLWPHFYKIHLWTIRFSLASVKIVCVCQFDSSRLIIEVVSDVIWRMDSFDTKGFKITWLLDFEHFLGNSITITRMKWFLQVVTSWMSNWRFWHVSTRKTLICRFGCLYKSNKRVNERMCVCRISGSLRVTIFVANDIIWKTTVLSQMGAKSLDSLDYKHYKEIRWL